jgi:hypothetical protein
VKPGEAKEISVDGRIAIFGLKKNRQPTEKTFDRSVTGESTPTKDQKGRRERC